jgi:hypothetical protein
MAGPRNQKLPCLSYVLEKPLRVYTIEQSSIKHFERPLNLKAFGRMPSLKNIQVNDPNSKGWECLFISFDDRQFPMENHHESHVFA